MLTKSVELVRGEAGFGFSVIGGSDTYLPPMVFTLAPNKAAHSSGQVCNLVRYSFSQVSKNRFDL